MHSAKIGKMSHEKHMSALPAKVSARAAFYQHNA